MTYTLGGTITAADYNSLIASVNAVWGQGTGDSGYGGRSKNVLSNTVNLPSLAANDVVENEQWLDLRNALADCAAHQGTTLPDALPSLADIEDGDPVEYFPTLMSAANIALLTTNRFNIDLLNYELITKLSSTRTTAWGTGNLGQPVTITHEFTVSFTDSDHARHFFNTDGDIRFAASRTGGSTSPQNQSWTDMLASHSFIFTHTHYYALTTSDVTLAKFYPSATTTYGNPDAVDADKNSWTITARRDDAAGPNGGNGSIIHFKSIFYDGFYGPTEDGLAYPPYPATPVGGLPDLVDGILTSSISQKRSFEYFNIPTPVYTNIVQLNT